MTENNIIISEYKQKYLNQIVKLWNETLVYDLISKEIFIKKIILDDNFDKSLCLLALDNDKVVGFILAMKRKYPYMGRGIESDRGWINIHFVKKEYQNKGIGQKLLDCVEKKLFELGTLKITLCAYSPNYFTPGIDLKYESGIKFYENNNYKFKAEAVSMKVELWNFYINQTNKNRINNLAKEGYKFSEYSFNYYEKMIDFIQKNFSEGWLVNFLNLVKKNEANETVLICVDSEDSIVGFCMRKIDGYDSRFGPIGVDPKLQSEGIGGTLTELMLENVKSKGFKVMYFLWTGGKNIKFYEKHGFKIYRKYNLYDKIIQR